ncbi:MAG: hypothetical protein P8R42_20600 [Candidatus Binatia bacterium]|nr:hypothetical protein [Candidatus Binatia bacterium]
MNRKKLARSSVAALVALGLASAPAFADEIEAVEIIVGEEIVAPPAEPCPECAVNNGAVTIAVGNDVTNAYFFRGILQEKTGVIWQPWGEVSFGLYEAADDSELISDVSLTLGTWNSVQTSQTSARRPGGTGPGNWYESDLYAAIGMGMNNGVGVGVSYIAYMSPNNAFGTVQEIDLDLSYDDSGLYSGEMQNLGFGLNPYGLISFELDKTRFGTEEGIYAEVGIEPSVSVMGDTDYPVTIGVPLTMGMSVDNYYLPTNNLNGSNPGDDWFGYASAGVGVGVPLAFVPARFGSFSAGVSGQWLALGSNLQRFNNGPSNGNVGTKTNPEEGRFGEWIGVASVNWEY